MDEQAKSTHVHGGDPPLVVSEKGEAQEKSNGAPAIARALTIREVAALTDVTVHTLRYYERIGLLAGVPRAASGHRRYGDEEVRWVVFLRKIHSTGMPIRRMQEYARLMRRGPSTARERRLLLEAHRDEVKARLDALHANLEMIDKKIAMYEEMETGAKVAPSDPARASGSKKARLI